MILLKIKILRKFQGIAISFDEKKEEEKNNHTLRLTATKPNIQLTLSEARIVIDDRVEEKAECSQATKKFDWRVGRNGEQNLWQEFVLLRGIAGLSRTRRSRAVLRNLEISI